MNDLLQEFYNEIYLLMSDLLQEIPYVIEHRLMGWKELKDGSLRVEQHFIAPKQSQRQILVGKNGSKIG
jgi:GTPase Era involved in 16S rRNA processing